MTFFQPYGVRLLLCSIVFLPSMLHAQSIEEVRNSGSYYFGIGVGNNYNAARRDALESLTGSISVNVQSKFEQVVRDTGSEVETFAKSVINTYSSAVINRYEERVIKEGRDEVELLVFISKAQMEDVFAQRVQLITDFVKNANRAEGERRIADALRYYYWALILARSHPDNTRLRLAFEGGKEEPVMMGLYDRINRIFSFTDVRARKYILRENPLQRELVLDMRYKMQPVQDLDYIYWMGDGYSAPVSARNGVGVATLQGEFARDPRSLRLRLEYQYQHKARLEPEVQLMLESVELPYFERADITVLLDGKAASNELPEDMFKEILEEPQAKPSTKNSASAKVDYRPALESIVSAIAAGEYSRARSHFSESGYVLFDQLMKNGKVTLLPPAKEELSTWQAGEHTMVRSIPMAFSYQNNRTEFVEDVVFSFGPNGKVDNVTYALGDVAVKDILGRPSGFGSMEERYQLIGFMEDYKTAYALKRHDFLEAIFDDQALIIVGNVVRRDAAALDQRGFYSGLGQQDVEYIQLSKSEYMDRLGRIFQRNEFINLRFEDNQVRKTQKDEKIYGIQIAQHYYSSTYADKGYLFLMIDLNDSLNPKIYVRTWQPEKNADGSVFGLEDFRF